MKREPHKAMTSGLNYGQAMWVVGVKGVFKAGGLTPAEIFQTGPARPPLSPKQVKAPTQPSRFATTSPKRGLSRPC